ncbi:MAG: response regulator [Anaerolineales bacterium]
MAITNRNTKPKILLVESNELLRDVLREVFENYGYCIVAVETAKDGSQILRDDCHDIVISDFDLKDRTGVEFFKSMKSVCSDKTTILMINYGDLDNISGAKKHGIHHVIEKPFLIRELLQIVEEAFQSRLTA